MVTDLLAVEFARRGYHCGILDADITGPSIPKAFGITEKAQGNETTIFPVKSKKYGDDWYDYKHYLSEKDLTDIKTNTGVSLNCVFYPKGADLSFLGNISISFQHSAS